MVFAAAHFHSMERELPSNIYLFKVNNRKTGERFEICSKLILKTLFLVFLLLNLNK